MKTLVAYFSASGVTKAVAETLAKAANADTFEIVPQTLYTKADLNWRDTQSRSTLEMNDKTNRPAMAKILENMDDYDTVFIGFPIWWYVAPRIIDTFLESYPFTGKTLIPFATSGSSGLGKTEEGLKEICPHALWKPGKLLNGSPSESELIKWVASLGVEGTL
jgi:flavodoxin